MSINAISEALPLAAGRPLANRIAKSAMTEKLADRSGAPTDRLLALYRRWGRSGAGLLITGNVMVDASALEQPGNVVADRAHLPRLRAWAEAGQRDGAQVWVQLNHPGRQTPRSIGGRPVAPSEVPLRGLFGLAQRPRALTPDEITSIIGRFATSAALVREAGFSGVQLLAAHGYLVSQFLSPLANRRTDEWGGSPENRRRFLVESVRAVRRAVGRDFPISVKLNSSDFRRGGMDEDEALITFGMLDDEGVDLIEISGGSYESAVMLVGPPAAGTREAYFADFATAARRRARHARVMVTGGFRTANAMASAIAGGALDVVGLARPFAVEPELPRRILAGEAERVGAVALRIRPRRFQPFLESAWYGRQIVNLAEGAEPDLALPRWPVLVRSLKDYLPVSRRA
jgi:2,4-dienoyl-CoA reductase-like NADH-dependent reductase (Old Yellow Enzyme family)